MSVDMCVCVYSKACAKLMYVNKSARGTFQCCVCVCVRSEGMMRVDVSRIRWIGKGNELRHIT